MGSECDPCKRRHYDLSMSKRTRKPSSPVAAVKPHEGPECVSPVKDCDEYEKNDYNCSPKVGKTSLKDLFIWDGGTDFEVSNAEAKLGLGGKNSLGNHFKQEGKNLKVFMKEEEEGEKLGGAVSRYARILSRLIRINKRDHRLGSVKKTVLRLTM